MGQRYSLRATERAEVVVMRRWQMAARSRAVAVEYEEDVMNIQPQKQDFKPTSLLWPLDLAREAWAYGLDAFQQRNRFLPRRIDLLLDERCHLCLKLGALLG